MYNVYKVVENVVSSYVYDKNKIVPSADLEEDLLLDEDDLVNIMSDVCYEYDIDIDLEHVTFDKFRKLEDIVNFVVERLH